MRHRQTAARPEFQRLELEGGADVYGLAVAAVVLERRKSVTLDVVADAAGQGDVP